MPTVQRLHLPGNVPLGFLQTYDQNRRFTLPPNRKLVYCPPSNRSNASYLNAGVSAIYKNAPEVGTFFQSGCCLDFNALMGYANSQLSGKVLSQWTQDDCRNFVNSQFASRDGGYAFFTHQWQETHGLPADNWQMMFGTDQQRWIEQFAGERQAQLGGSFHSGYNGEPNAQSSSEDLGNTEKFRPAFTNPQAAIQLAIEASGGDTYFTHGWQYHDGLVQTYATDTYDWRKFQFRTVLNMLLWRLAMLGLGGVALTRKLMAFGWYGEAQAMPPNVFHVRYKIPVPGGVYEITRPAQWPFEAQVSTALLAYLFAEILLAWESGARTGSDKRYQRPQGSGIGNSSQYIGTGGVEYANDAPAVHVTDRPVCYADGPKGYQDVPLLVSEWVGLMHEHAGWANMGFCASRSAGSTSPFMAVTAAFPIDAYQQNKPFAVAGGNGSKGWLVFGDFTGEPGQQRTSEVNTPLGIATITQDSHTCRCYLLN